MRQAIELALLEKSPQADTLARLARLDAPTGDLDQMLAEIDCGFDAIDGIERLDLEPR